MRADIDTEADVAWNCLKDCCYAEAKTSQKRMQVLAERALAQQQARAALEEDEAHARLAIRAEEQERVQAPRQALREALRERRQELQRREWEALETARRTECQRQEAVARERRREYVQRLPEWLATHTSRMLHSHEFISRHRLWAWLDSMEALELQQQARSDWSRFVDASNIRALVRQVSPLPQGRYLAW